MRKFNNIVLGALVFLLFLNSCSNPKQKFSEEEKIEAQLFFKSFTLEQESVSVSNSREYTGIADNNTINKILNLKKQALSTANEISDDVLKKIHPDLPIEYINYKKGLELRIYNLEKNDIESELIGSGLLDKWGDWYMKNKRNIKVPKLNNTAN